MTNQPYDQTPDTASKKDVAADEAKKVGVTAQQGGQQVAETAKAEAAALASEAKMHAGDLFAQVRAEASTQAADQTARIATTLRTIAQDLTGMSTGAQPLTTSSTASSLVGQASGQVEQVARWLENREPAELLDDVRRYARRNPGTFIAGAALLGFLGARFTRGLQADQQVEQRRGYVGYTGTGYGYDARQTQRGMDPNYVETGYPAYERSAYSQTQGQAAQPYGNQAYETRMPASGQPVSDDLASAPASDLKPGDLYR